MNKKAGAFWNWSLIALFVLGAFLLKMGYDWLNKKLGGILP